MPRSQVPTHGQGELALDRHPLVVVLHPSSQQEFAAALPEAFEDHLRSRVVHQAILSGFRFPEHIDDQVGKGPVGHSHRDLEDGPTCQLVRISESRQAHRASRRGTPLVQGFSQKAE